MIFRLLHHYTVHSWNIQLVFNETLLLCLSLLLFSCYCCVGGGILMNLSKSNNLFVFLCLSCWISFADALSWSVATPIITLGMVSRSSITMHLKKSMFCTRLHDHPILITNQNNQNNQNATASWW